MLPVPNRLRVRRRAPAAALLAAGCTAAATAQTLPNPAVHPYQQSGLPMQSILWEATTLATAGPTIDASGKRTQPAAALADLGLEATPDQLVHVEIVGPDDGLPPPGEEFDEVYLNAEWAVLQAALTPLGVEFEVFWNRRADAWAPAQRLVEIAEALPAGYYLQRANIAVPDEVVGEGPGVTFSDIWATAGANGTGVTVGVIDTQFQGFNAARANGDAPPAGQTTTNAAFAGGAGANVHGTACTEQVFDHAPGASYRLYQVSTVATLGTAVADFIANAAAPRLITHSLSWYNQGWGDTSGAACAAALNAAQNNILFFTSAGNREETHYQATFVAAGGNPIPGWHQWLGGDETNNMNVPAGGTVNFWLSWDNSDNTTDYDLYLYNDAITVELAKSINVGAGAAQFEFISWTNPGGAAVNTHLGVRRMAGAAVQFELFESTFAATWQYRTVGNSTTSPSNTNHQSVLAVGAVDFNNFGSPNGTGGIIESYSSRGPTNGGLLAPDFCGPTNITCFAYGGAFSGTSCATPNAAGMTAALWSANTTKAHTIIRDAIKAWPLAYQDWGAAGFENIYGRGGTLLPEIRIDIYPNRFPNRIYLSRNYTIYVGAIRSDTFNPQTDLNNLTKFGRSLAAAVSGPTSVPPLYRDFDLDGDTDAIFGFRTFDCGFQMGNTIGVLKGDFINQAPFATSGPVQVNP